MTFDAKAALARIQEQKLERKYFISLSGEVEPVKFRAEETLRQYEAAGNLFPTEEAAEEELARRIAVWNEKYNPPTKQVSVTFEVKEVDEPRTYTWDEAMAAFDRNEASEWRLPTRTELAIMYESRAEIGGFTDGRYWSSEEENEYASWNQRFSNGVQNYYFKTNSFAVRLLRKEQP